MVSAKAAKKSKAANKRTAPAKKPKKTKAAPTTPRGSLVHLRLIRPELAKLDAEVGRRRAAEPEATVTRATVLQHLVSGLPGAKPATSGAPLAEGQDAHGKYMDVAIGALTQRFRFIPAATFTMGSPPTESGRWDDEGPQHEVRLSQGYWMADTQVTQALYEAVMGSNPSRYKGAERPVETVSWDDAKAFLSRLNAMVPGLDARLPTEAEWENACRAGTTGATWIGELEGDGVRAPKLDAIAWYYGNSPNGTQPVKQKAPNPWGLYDMLGNVYEWCEDRYGPYGADLAVDPRGPGPSAGSYRVIRGGCWGGYSRRVRAAYRHGDAPDSRYGLLGLRLARGHQV